MTPLSYAAKLAGYISDPSTIRTYTLAEFGRAPTLEQCRNLRKAKEQEKVVIEGYHISPYRFRPLFKCGHPETDDNIIIAENGNDHCKACHDAKVAKEQADWNRRVEARRVMLAERAAAKEAKLAAESQKRQNEIQDALNKLIEQPASERPKVASNIIQLVASRFRVIPADITGLSRKHILVDARCAVVILLRERGLSLPRIGDLLNRDHSSILHLLRTAGKRSERNPMILKAVAALR